MIRPLLFSAVLLWLGWLVTPVLAETVHSWGPAGYSSTITLQPTTAPEAVAELVFDNKAVHNDEAVTFVLELDGLEVTVDALVGRGLTPDRMTVSVPVGYIAVPPEIDVPEDEVGRVLVIPWTGM